MKNSLVCMPSGFDSIFTKWVGEANFDLRVDFFYSMIKEDDFFYFLYAWAAVFKSLDYVYITKVVTNKDVPSNILVQKLFINCVANNTKDVIAGFTELPNKEYKKFFDFMLAKDNFNFLVALAGKKFNLTIPLTTLNNDIFKETLSLAPEIKCNIPYKLRDKPFFPTTKISFNSFIFTGSIHIARKTAGVLDFYSKSLKIRKVITKLLEVFTDCILYFGYRAGVGKETTIFVLFFTADTTTIKSIDNGFTNFSLEKYNQNTYINTAGVRYTTKVKIEYPIYTFISKNEDLFIEDFEYKGNIFLFGVGGFTSAVLVPTKVCTLPTKFIASQKHKRYKALFEVLGHSFIVRLSLLTKKTRRIDAYLFTYIYKINNKIVNCLPGRIRYKKRPCRSCGRYTQEVGNKMCGRCKIKLARTIDKRGRASIFTTTARSLNMLDDFLEEKISVGGGDFKYKVSCADGEVLFKRVF